MKKANTYEHRQMNDRQYKINREMIGEIKEALGKCMSHPYFTEELHKSVLLYLQSMEFWNERRNQQRLDREKSSFVKLCSPNFSSKKV